MPTYEVECPKCQTQDEFVSVIAERDATPSCKECGEKTKRVISAVRGFVDFPAAGGQGYVSHTSGRYIDSKRKRTDDLKRTGCRPWEGFEQEVKEQKRQEAYEEKKSDAKLEDAVRKAYHQLPPEKRAVLSAD